MSKRIHSDSCPDCNKAKENEYHPVYHLACHGCAQRIVMNEQCKLQRNLMAEYLQMRYELATDWKREPSCGCEKVCKRNANRSEPNKV
jgi:hypothetical protein